MTREDATEIWLPIIKMGVISIPECYEALDMAIKALKQEPCTEVLDKIRAEIDSPNRGTCDYFIVDRIEEIIDKYKASPTGAESEE